MQGNGAGREARRAAALADEELGRNPDFPDTEE